MKIFFKFLLSIFFLSIVIILFFILFLFVNSMMYKVGIYEDNYNYIESIIFEDKRYSLYNRDLFHSIQWVIFEHEIAYKEYKEVEISKVSLYVLNDNPNDKFIYEKRFEDDRIPKFELLNEKLIVLSFEGIYFFGYDIKKEELYNTIYWNDDRFVRDTNIKYGDQLRKLYEEDRLIYENRYDQSIDYLEWQELKVHEEILLISEKRN